MADVRQAAVSDVLDVARVETPIGPLFLAAAGGALVALSFEGGEEDLGRRFAGSERRQTADPAGAVTALRRYFEGDLAALERVAVDPGGTAFQQRVWAELRRIPVGRTVSYAQLARAIGSPDAVRAVGLANGRNPVAVVIPCHRVIASDGTLCGYGGGLDRKRWLLDHEKAGGPGVARRRTLF